jgi:hypothetical protein
MSLLWSSSCNNQGSSKISWPKTSLAFRNFPITQVHAHAQQAAEAAESSGGQNKFWEMRDCLYERQQALDYKHLETYAALLGLDLAQFIYDMSNHVYLGRVREDFLSGILSGLNGHLLYKWHTLQWFLGFGDSAGGTHIGYPEKPMIQLSLVSLSV